MLVAVLRDEVDGARQMTLAVRRRREGVDHDEGIESAAQLVTGDEGRHGLTEASRFGLGDESLGHAAGSQYCGPSLLPPGVSRGGACDALGGGAGRSTCGRGGQLRAHGRAVPGAPTPSRRHLDGVNGPDIVIALPLKVGVMLNHGDGTFAALQQYAAGPACGRAGLAVDITLGDVTQPAGQPLAARRQARRLRRVHADVVRLTGDGTGALSNPEARQHGRRAVPRARTRSTCSRWCVARTAIQSRCSCSSTRSGASAASCASATIWSRRRRLQPHVGAGAAGSGRPSTVPQLACPPDEIVTSEGDGQRWGSSASPTCCR